MIGITGGSQHAGPDAAVRHHLRPALAVALGIPAGALIVLGGALEAVRWLGSSPIPHASGTGFAPYLLGMIGILLGLVVVTTSLRLWYHPEDHAVLGVVILCASALSVVAFWGLVVGLLLGIGAGSLAATWEPLHGSSSSAGGPGPESPRGRSAPLLPSSSAGERAVYWNVAYDRRRSRTERDREKPPR